MALTTRSLTNVGDALVDPNGGVLSGAVVTFQLCQPGGRPTDAWDATTGERIGGLKATTTNGSGEFTIALWPNDRGNVRTQYRCTVQWKNYFRDFYGSLPSGSGSYLWVDFFALGEALTPAGISALYDHITDTTVHLSAAQNTFLDALNLPTLTATEVNYLIGVTSAVQTQLDARALASRLLIAAGGLVGGGNLTNDRAFSVGANADGSIVVNTDDIQVGVLATDAQHGNRGGGTQHANAVAAGAAGFMTGADKTKLDGITAGAAVASVSGAGLIASTGGTTPVISLPISAASKLVGRQSGSAGAAQEITLGTNLTMTGTTLDAAGGATLSSTTPASVGTAAVGVGTTVARADHVHNLGYLDAGAALSYLINNFATSVTAPTVGHVLAGNNVSATVFVDGKFSQGAVSDTHTFTASRDTYIDWTVSGIVYTAVLNSTAAPALTANSVRVLVVVTDATQITGVTFLNCDLVFRRNVRFADSVTEAGYINDDAAVKSVTIPMYAVDELPPASNGAGQIAYAINEIGGPTIVFSDGSDWRRVQDRAGATF